VFTHVVKHNFMLAAIGASASATHRPAGSPALKIAARVTVGSSAIRKSSALPSTGRCDECRGVYSSALDPLQGWHRVGDRQGQQAEFSGDEREKRHKRFTQSSAKLAASMILVLRPA